MAQYSWFYDYVTPIWPLKIVQGQMSWRIVILLIWFPIVSHSNHGFISFRLVATDDFARTWPWVIVIFNVKVVSNSPSVNSHRYSIVTMALSRTVCSIGQVLWFRDPDLTSQGPSRSKIMTDFEPPQRGAKMAYVSMYVSWNPFDSYNVLFLFHVCCEPAFPRNLCAFRCRTSLKTPFPRIWMGHGYYFCQPRSPLRRYHPRLPSHILSKTC